MRSASAIAIGIDGGGTSTRATIIDADGIVLGNGESGPSNYQAVGVESTRSAIADAIAAAWNRSGTPPRSASAIFLGMAGVLSTEDRATIERIVREIEPEAIIDVDHDLRPALAAGVGSGEGIVLVAGTGSACYGRTNDGISWRSGGWGHILDDAGGGYRLGLDGLIAVVRSADGRAAATSLSSSLLQAIGITGTDDILRTVHQSITRSDIAALAPLVLDAAADGDAAAIDIIGHGATELAMMAGAVHRALVWSASPPLVPSGSLFHNATYRSAVVSAVAEAIPGITFSDPTIAASEAAARLAAERVGRGAKSQEP